VRESRLYGNGLDSKCSVDLKHVLYREERPGRRPVGRVVLEKRNLCCRAEKGKSQNARSFLMAEQVVGKNGRKGDSLSKTQKNDAKVNERRQEDSKTS